MENQKFDLDAVVNKWKGKEGNLIMILHEIQDNLGYVPREVALQLSPKIDVPLAKIYEVLSFYHFFKLNPPAKTKISVCTGTACYLKGAQSIINELENHLGIKTGATTANGEFSINSVRCVGCCVLSPVMSINGKIYGAVKPADVPNILNQYASED